MQASAQTCGKSAANSMIQNVAKSQVSILQYDEMQASAQTCGKSAANSMIQNVAKSQVSILQSSLTW